MARGARLYVNGALLVNCTLRRAGLTGVLARLQMGLKKFFARERSLLSLKEMTATFDCALPVEVLATVSQ